MDRIGCSKINARFEFAAIFASIGIIIGTLFLPLSNFCLSLVTFDPTFRIIH